LPKELKKTTQHHGRHFTRHARHEMIFDRCQNPDFASKTGGKVRLSKLLDRAFRNSPTGETRKVMLIRALSSKPGLTFHPDEPFDGLDVDPLAMLQEHSCL